jgi:hypothetical protein
MKKLTLIITMALGVMYCKKQDCKHRYILDKTSTMVEYKFKVGYESKCKVAEEWLNVDSSTYYNLSIGDEY